MIFTKFHMNIRTQNPCFLYGRHGFSFALKQNHLIEILILFNLSAIKNKHPESV